MASEPVRIEPWAPGYRWLLERLLCDPAMMGHLGGPETPEKIAQRQARYEGDPRQFRIVRQSGGDAVGWVGYWERAWRGENAFEVGWFVLPEWHGRGIAASATSQLIELAAAEDSRRYMHAFPAVGNAPSNAIARKLGFELLGEFDFPYPPGSGRTLRCNDWRHDLGSLDRPFTDRPPANR